jgi:hypothetical protein
MNQMIRRFIAFALLTLLLALAVEAVQAQDPTATPEGSASQLSLGFEPTLGLKMMLPDSQFRYFSSVAYGGGQTYLSVGDPCPSGYTSVVSTLGTIWVDPASAPADIVFESTQPGANVSIFLYDLMTTQWHCNLTFAPTAVFHWDSFPRGVYFVWIVSDQPGAVSGNLTISGTPATTEPTVEPTLEPTIQPTRGR